MSEPIKQIIRFILFILVQALVLSHMPPVHRFITPYLYFLYILWLPFNMPRVGLTLVGFLLGLTLDYFTKTGDKEIQATILFVNAFYFLRNRQTDKANKALDEIIAFKKNRI